MPARSLFITGTDTGVGKTLASTALLRWARAQGLAAAGFKPVAAGCERVDGAWRNDDALRLQAESTGAPPYEQVNPCALPDAVAPHLAAQSAGTRIDIAALDAAHARLSASVQLLVIEGAGGWRVPLDEHGDFADWVTARGWPVVLVVGLRLGCLNHALLSAESIARGAPLAGWIANVLPPEQPRWQDNLETLRRRLPAPLLGCIPMGADIATAAAALDSEATRRLLRA
ncbi:MAG TPA: dethiobiotin synthase [Solimonas sp.]|nr:dethiobiotin synthase [Solimonas sp.]